MRAAYAEHGQIVMKDVDEPTPGPGQLLIAVKAAGLNAADRLIVNGHYVTEHLLEPLDEVRIGDALFKFVGENATAFSTEKAP